MNWFKFFGLSMIIMSAGDVVGRVIDANYSGAGISICIGIGWIWLIEFRSKRSG